MIKNNILPNRIRWWHSSLIWEHYNKLISGHKDGIIELLRQTGKTFERGVSIGCGNANKELKLVKEGIVNHFELFDTSENRINEGIEKARELNILKYVSFHKENVFEYNEKESVNLVFWHDSLHHMFDVNYAINWSRDVLRQDGIFCMNEYVGANRFQWSDESIILASSIRSLLPKNYFISPYNPKEYLNPIIDRCNPLALEKDDPSEAVNSSRIIECVIQYFPNVEIKKLGGIIYLIALSDIIYNFDENNENDRNLLKALLLIDEILIGKMESCYAVAIAEKT